jgi:hypothetical protein
MKSNTVFGHLVHQFAVHPENLATEALSFILRTSPAASGAFTDFVRQILADCPTDMHFETQQVGVNQSIPDMKCFDDAGNIRVIVENKFWAGLTDNQPVTYIRELPPGIGSLVLLVVPEARRQIVWDEVVSRCRNNKVPIGDVQKLETFVAAGIDAEHFLAATSWSALLNALATAASLAAEVESLNDIAQLSGLCKRMDEEGFLPLRSEEITNLGMARRIINLADLPFSIVDEAENQGLCDKKGLREVAYRYGAGRYVRIGKYSAWVGFNALQWKRLGVSPISVNFYPEYCPIAEVRTSLSRFRNTTPPRCFDMEVRNYKWVVVPIFLTAGVEKHRIIEDAVLQIRELWDELRVKEPLPVAPTPRLTDAPDTIPECHPTSQVEKTTAETILELGAEGGSIILFGNRDVAGMWRFWTQTDETSMSELLDEEDLRELGSLVKTSPVVSSLTEAFALLDEYPWRSLTPIQIHPDFRLAILHEVQKRGTPEEAASWSANALFLSAETLRERTD